MRKQTEIEKTNSLSFTQLFNIRPVYCGQPEPEAFGQCPWVTAGPECSQTRPTSQIRRPLISRSSPLQRPAFSRSSQWHRAPHFSLCRGTYLPKCGSSAPPPPPPPRDLLYPTSLEQGSTVIIRIVITWSLSQVKDNMEYLQQDYISTWTPYEPLIRQRCYRESTYCQSTDTEGHMWDSVNCTISAEWQTQQLWFMF